MRILILAAEEKGSRHNRWMAALEAIGGVSSRLVLKSRSYVLFFFHGLLEARRFKPHVIMSVGPDLMGVTSLIISKLASRRPVILFLGGDPIAVRRDLLRAMTRSDIFGKMRYEFLCYLNSHYVYKYFRHFMVNSSYLGTQLLLHNPHFRDKHVFVVPQPVTVERRSIKEVKGDQDNRIRMLTVTNLRHPAKYRGVLELVEFLQKYTNETTLDRKLVFDICGGGIWSDHLRNRVRTIRSRKDRLSVRYLGFVENLESMYEKAHLFLYSSSLDSLPRVLLEAQSFGLPMLVNDFEAFQEIIEDGYNGLLYKSGDFEDFKKRLDMLISDPHLSHSLSRNALENLRRKYSVEVIGKKLEGVLQTVLPQNGERLG